MHVVAVLERVFLELRTISRMCTNGPRPLVRQIETEPDQATATHPVVGHTLIHSAKEAKGSVKARTWPPWVGAQGCKRLFGECERRIGFETPV